MLFRYTTILLLATLGGLISPSTRAESIDVPRIAKTIVIDKQSSVSAEEQLTAAPSVLQKEWLPNAARRRPHDASAARYVVNDFSIYSASTRRLADLDDDGFAYKFALTFDADVASGMVADVYAVVFISRDGGAWNHFHTTDVFRLYGRSVDDAIDTVSVLEEGYPPGYYDFLIELYSASDGVFLTDFGPLDTHELSALMLEDIEHDNYFDGQYDYLQTQVVVSGYSYGGGGGTLDGVLGVILLGLLLVRVRRG